MLPKELSENLKRLSEPQTTDTQWRHKSKKSKNLGQCGRQNMLRSRLRNWYRYWIFGRAVKAIFSPGVGSRWSKQNQLPFKKRSCRRPTYIYLLLTMLLSVSICHLQIFMKNFSSRKHQLPFEVIFVLRPREKNCERLREFVLLSCG